MNKKAAVELSINVLVVIIISLVILAGGITLLYKFIGGAEEQQQVLDQRTKQELERLLVDRGKKVALAFNMATLTRGESHLFGLGLLNVGEQADFNLVVELSQALDETGTEMAVEEDLVDRWMLYDTDSLTLESNQQVQELISVGVPKDALNGQYLFNVRVLSNGQQYGNTQKLYVTVK